MRIYYCGVCGGKAEVKNGESKKCSGCDKIFGCGEFTSNGEMYINMNPMSRRTDIEFGSMDVRESTERMRKASYENKKAGGH